MVAATLRSRKPVIGFSTWRRSVTIPPYGSFTMEVASTEYLRSAQEQGAAVVMLPHGEEGDAALVLDGLDGLVLIGGDDLDPTTYGQVNDGLSHGTDAEADRFQVALVAEARARGLPTLAVCRGLQVTNAALGGTLHQDISGGELAHQAPDGDGSVLPSTTHRVDVQGSCVLQQVYGPTVEVNSIHHQAVDRVAEGLRVVGLAPDGTVEAVESDDTDRWPLVGVQWHPEKITTGAPLFAWLVDRARRRATPPAAAAVPTGS